MADSQNDAMISRLEGELEERNAFIQGAIASAEDASRDLTDSETELIKSAKGRIDTINGQLNMLYDTRSSTIGARETARKVSAELTRMRAEVESGPVEYRSAGAYMHDTYRAHLGDKSARARLEVFERAAAHEKTSDVAGAIPTPVVGPVINFIDASRPMVSTLGARALPSETWKRPIVNQHTAVALQGTAGLAADQKTELVSQKLTIGSVTGTAKTYGGYVNVARQIIDFGAGSLDVIVSDLAAQYSIETEAALGDAIAATTTAAVGYGASPTATTIAGAVWEAAGQAYTATKGLGQLVIVCAPDVLGTFGPLFPPVNPQNAQSQGLSAGAFGQGPAGGIAGVSLVMSAGLASGTSYMLSTAAIEAYEQRGGNLQAIEPSVLGMQVAYFGYFAPLMINDDAVIPLTAS